MDRMRATLGRLRRWGEEKANAVDAAAPATAEDAEAFLRDVLTRFPYTEEARRWLSTEIAFEVVDLRSTRGGGFWIPDQNKVQLFTAQYEAAIHELAHAWWHTRRIGATIGRCTRGWRAA